MARVCFAMYLRIQGSFFINNKDARVRLAFMVKKLNYLGLIYGVNKVDGRVFEYGWIKMNRTELFLGAG